jgi:hypothetical protein
MARLPRRSAARPAVRFGALRVRPDVSQMAQEIRRDLDLYAEPKGAAFDFSWPEKPTDSALIESFNGKVRAKRIRQNARFGSCRTGRLDKTIHELQMGDPLSISVFAY